MGFSVVTISKRRGWEALAYQSIRKQTVQPEKWVIVQEDGPVMVSFLSELYNGGLPVSQVTAPEAIRPSNLNAATNEGLRQVDSDYVIFYQDFIELPEDCFEKLLALADDKTFVTTCTPNYDGSDDGRYLGVDGPRPCRPAEWEINVAIAPMKALRELGGFEEELDLGWSWDNVNVAERAALLGYKFAIDESNRPKLLPHEMTSRLQLELNGDRHARIMEEIRKGIRPIKSKYL